MINIAHIDTNCEMEPMQLGDILFGHSEHQRIKFMETSLIYQNYPTLYFPQKAHTKIEVQSQQQNYDYLVHVMAEMLKKYASDIQEMEV